MFLLSSDFLFRPSAVLSSFVFTFRKFVSLQVDFCLFSQECQLVKFISYALLCFKIDRYAGSEVHKAAGNKF